MGRLSSAAAAVFAATRHREVGGPGQACPTKRVLDKGLKNYRYWGPMFLLQPQGIVYLQKLIDMTLQPLYLKVALRLLSIWLQGFRAAMRQI